MEAMMCRRAIRRQGETPGVQGRRRLTASEVLETLNWTPPRPTEPAKRLCFMAVTAIVRERCADASTGSDIRHGLSERETAKMNRDQETAHAEHLRQGQDHFEWRREHMEALAILKRTEAAIFTHEARIIAHDTEIARHEEQIAHGAAHSSTPPSGEHSRFSEAHESMVEHHVDLLNAIRGLEPFIAAGDDK
jgi:hypothetical protein